MRIGGFQKMTMLDFPGRVACTVFTLGCPLRCPFCHNAPLVVGEQEPIPEEEVFSYLEKRRGILDGVCITGGEPLMWPDLFDFIARIRSLGLAVKLDTNGAYPDRLAEAISRGLLDYVAMDVKNSREKYPLTAGVPQLDVAPFEESVRLLLAGRVPYEFRTTVVAELHEEADIAAIGAWLRGAERYYLQSFQDSGSLLGEGLSAHPRSVLERFLAVVRADIPHAALRGV